MTLDKFGKFSCNNGPKLAWLRIWTSQNLLYNPADQTIFLASQPELCLTVVVGLALNIMLKYNHFSGGHLSPSQGWKFDAANCTITVNLSSDPTTMISVATVLCSIYHHFIRIKRKLYGRTLVKHFHKNGECNFETNIEKIT